MVRILHIETATKVCSVGISENGKMIDLIEESSDQYIHAEKLTVFIDQLMQSLSLKFSDLSAVAVTSGPGSYTGLRIGVSSAKGICFAKDIPLISIGALDGIINQAKEIYPNHSICAMIDARRMEVFSKIVDIKGEVRKELSADVLDNDSYIEYRPFIACGDGASKCDEIWEKSDIKIDTNILSSVKGQLPEAYEKYKREEFEDLAYFEPLYLKDFIASKPKKKFFS